MKPVLNSTVLLLFAHAALGQTSFSICKGDSVRLHATGGNLYEWQPHTGLSSPYVANPWANPQATTIYRIVKLQTSGNLIANGDFSQGDIGFSSQYRDSTNVIREGFYTITANPRDAHFAFRPCADHTTGSGKMMVVNGSHVQNQRVWSQQIQVNPNTNYAFSAFVNAGISSGDKAILQFSINGQLLNSAFTIPNIRCEWQQFYAVWNSGTSTVATISLVNQNTQRQGNDFALDDIRFERFTTVTDSITVSVLPSPAKPVLSINGSNRFCQGNSRIVTIQGNATDTPFWNNGSRQRSIIVSSDSTLWVKVQGQNGCFSKPSDTVRMDMITAPPRPILSAISDTGLLCDGDSVLLKPSVTFRPDSSFFIWSGNVRKDSAWVRQNGHYSVRLVTPQGCESQASNFVHLRFNNRPAKPILTRTGLALLCQGDTFTLAAQPQPGAYIWSNGVTEPSQVISEPGSYSLLVISPQRCFSLPSDTLWVASLPLPPTPVIVPKGTDSLECTSHAPVYIWKKDGLQIPSVARKISLAGPGIYTVQVLSTDGCRSDESIPYTMQITEFRPGLMDFAVNIAPNPASKGFAIFGEPVGPIIVRVKDAWGRTVYACKYNKGELIPTADWPVGMYFVTVTGSGVVKTAKLQVER